MLLSAKLPSVFPYVLACVKRLFWLKSQRKEGRIEAEQSCRLLSLKYLRSDVFSKGKNDCGMIEG